MFFTSFDVASMSESEYSILPFREAPIPITFALKSPVTFSAEFVCEEIDFSISFSLLF